MDARPARPARPALGLTVAESTPVFPPVPRPDPGAPNVAIIVLDDTGFAHLGCYGSDIATPHMDRLAAEGLLYNRFHVTALCSPTRASLLTGRNHHAVGVGFLVDLPMAFPGYDGRIPPSAATLPRLLRDRGYSTIAVGKWHLVPRGERSAAGPFDRWPLGLGFERYYGFLQGDTNHWTPNLVCDNHYVEPPAAPEDGYHLTEDLVDTATRYIQDQQHAAPGKPWMLYLPLGAMHSPHHVSPPWVEPYRGRFDRGWDSWREEIFARQLASGVVPEGTILSERPPWMSGWDQLTPDERRMHARQQEVFAGFLTHTDAQIGRLLQYLATSGQLDNTIVLLLSDNGASAEGGRLGTLNEHRFTSRLPETLEGNLAALDEWGGFRSYNHYSWGWAWAGNTPLRLWKRYTWLGGTRTPLIVHWPAGFRSQGEVRSQFCHVVDLMPTVLEACGVEAPAVVDGVTQQPMDGSSLGATWDDPTAPGRDTQYFEMLGSRSIVHQGWKATTDHVSQGVVDEELLMTGSRDFARDHWALFQIDGDFSESTDVSAQHPETVRELEQLWYVEAGRHQVLPIDETLTERLTSIIPSAYPPRPRSVFVAGASPVCDEAIPLLFGGFRMAADAEVPSTGAEGVLCALGDWNAGFALYVRDGLLKFAFSHAGDLASVEATRPVPAGRQTLGVTYSPGGDGGGTFTLLYGDEPVGSCSSETGVSFTFQHGGTGLCLGYDRGFPVCDDYQTPFRWTGTLSRLTIETPGASPAPQESVRAAVHSD
jgi:arylsulfatase